MSTYSNQLQPALQNLLRVVQFFHPRSSCTTHILADIFGRQKVTLKASDAAENLQLQHVVWFFHPRSSCTTHLSLDVQRITSNASCMTILGRRTEQLVIIAGFLPHHWLYEWFSQFHSCGTYSVLSRSSSIVFSMPMEWHMDITALGLCNSMYVTNLYVILCQFMSVASLHYIDIH